MTQLTEQRSRILGMLGVAADDVSASQEIDPPADSIGARDAVAFELPGIPTPVVVYDFPDQASAFEAKASLARSRPGFHRATVNGTLLMWAHSDTDDRDITRAITRLGSQFAGEE